VKYRGHVQNGVVVFDEPASLPEGAHVRVVILSEEVSADHDPATPTISAVIGSAGGGGSAAGGAAQGLPPDASLNIDHYLYGAPKRS
jgi:hypothetical protein